MTEIEKKQWKVRTADKGKEVSFSPTFEINMPPDAQVINATSKEVECVFVDMSVTSDKGEEVNLKFNFADLYLFIYAIANEEQRRQLQIRLERNVTNIPYELQFSLSKEEKQTGIAKRLITLSVDEITMAIAHSAANQLLGKTKPEFLESYIARKRASKKPTWQK